MLPVGLLRSLNQFGLVYHNVCCDRRFFFEEEMNRLVS